VASPGSAEEATGAGTGGVRGGETVDWQSLEPNRIRQQSP